MKQIQLRQRDQAAACRHAVMYFVLVLVACGSDVADMTNVADMIDPERQRNRWIGSEVVDEFTGETSYVAGQEQDRAVFVISCDVNRIVNVVFSVLNEEARDGFMQYRLDDSDIRSIEFDATEMAGFDSVMVLGGARAAEFIVSVLHSRELRVRIPVEQYDYYDHVDETFILEGLAEHAREVGRRCS